MAYGLEIFNSSGVLCFSTSDLFTRITDGPFRYTNLEVNAATQKRYVPGVHSSSLVQIAVMRDRDVSTFVSNVQHRTGSDWRGEWYQLVNSNSDAGYPAGVASGWCFVLRRD